MSEEWRALLYPLGFLSGLAFGARNLLQWALSEAKRKSVVNSAFWVISLVGNVLLLIHSTVQMQYHVASVQTINAIISWRNLDLMKAQKHRLSTVWILLVMSLTVTTGAFFLQSSDITSWVRVPQILDFEVTSTHPLWHVIGFVGIVLFSCRFWVQWWQAERRHKSVLGAAFWWTSLLGAIMSLAYFIHIHDIVNFIGPTFGMIPYVRNLMLIRRRSYA